MLQNNTYVKKAVTAVNKQFKYIDFDPTNKKHRAIFLEFKTLGKWPSNTRFNLDPLYGNVPSMINQKLLDFYFGRDRSIPEDLKKKYQALTVSYPISTVLTNYEEK